MSEMAVQPMVAREAAGGACEGEDGGAAPGPVGPPGAEAAEEGGWCGRAGRAGGRGALVDTSWLRLRHGEGEGLALTPKPITRPPCLNPTTMSPIAPPLLEASNMVGDSPF